MKFLKTEYGLLYQKTETLNPEWNEYDSAVAKSHLANWGFIVIDEYGNPIDNEYDLETIITK